MSHRRTAVTHSDPITAAVMSAKSIMHLRFSCCPTGKFLPHTRAISSLFRQHVSISTHCSLSNGTYVPSLARNSHRYSKRACATTSLSSYAGLSPAPPASPPVRAALAAGDISDSYTALRLLPAPVTSGVPAPLRSLPPPAAPPALAPPPAPLLTRDADPPACLCAPAPPPPPPPPAPPPAPAATISSLVLGAGPSHTKVQSLAYVTSKRRPSASVSTPCVGRCSTRAPV